jgi:hypothetical protein
MTFWFPLIGNRFKFLTNLQTLVATFKSKVRPFSNPISEGQKPLRKSLPRLVFYPTGGDGSVGLVRLGYVFKSYFGRPEATEKEFTKVSFYPNLRLG